MTVPYRVVQCRRDYQMSPKLELGHRKKVSMKLQHRGAALYLSTKTKGRCAMHVTLS